MKSKTTTMIIISLVSALLLARASAQTYSESSNVYGGSDNAGDSYGNSYKNNYYGYSGAYGTNLFVDSSNNYYDGYQQAWRYLGWYVKCGYPSDRYDDDGSGSHSGSGDNQRWSGNNYCQRYLIWAAYVDENYQGGGIGEYAYYDPYSGQWDASACDAHGNGRCAPMDCHENNSTTWKLMGVFKEASYFGNDAFFEQLFKHEGYCLWNDDDLYDFMSEAREEMWTQGCVGTGIQGDPYYFDNTDDDYGNYIYIDLKPTWNGNMTYGLYTDATCKTEYEGLDVDVDTVSANMGLLYGSYLESWNEALEVYKVCQPCKAYNLQNQYSTWNYNKSVGDYTYSKNKNDDDDSHESEEDDDQYRNDPNKGYFQCDDDADYTNVNQCMKFRSHAELEVATWEDLVTATNQGGILEVNVGGTIFGSERMSSAQYKYLLSMRRETLAANAKKLAALAVEVNKMEPEATMWLHRGYLLIAGGGSLLLIALFRLISRRIKRRQEEEAYTSPLLQQIPPGSILMPQHYVQSP